jgi:dienelactone hydrolase
LLLSEHVGTALAPPAAVAPTPPSTSFISSASSTSSFHIFALGESMGAGIVLQSAAADPRIEAVVAEAPSPISAKRPTITPDSASIRGLAKRSSLPAPGRCCIATKNSPDFPSRKSRR